MIQEMPTKMLFREECTIEGKHFLNFMKKRQKGRALDERVVPKAQTTQGPNCWIMQRLSPHTPNSRNILTNQKDQKHKIKYKNQQGMVQGKDNKQWFGQMGD